MFNRGIFLQRTTFKAIAAFFQGKTLIGTYSQLGGGNNPFRIAAPLAAERTSFKEQFCADSGPVVDGIFLNVEDESLGLTRRTIQHFYPPLVKG